MKLLSWTRCSPLQDYRSRWDGRTLTLLVDAKDGRLGGERIRAAVPHWQEASVWFCGTAGFGESLSADFAEHGLPRERFHQELFQMR